MRSWWEDRSIPASRMGLDEVLVKMGISQKNELLVKSFGLSLSDQYWINPDGKLTWDKVNFLPMSFRKM